MKLFFNFNVLADIIVKTSNILCHNFSNIDNSVMYTQNVTKRLCFV